MTVASDNAGESFNRVGGTLDAGFTALRAVSATTAYAAGTNGRIGRTTDSGQSWSTIGVSTADDIRDVSFPTPQTGYALDDSGTVLRTDNGEPAGGILDTGSGQRALALRAVSAREVVLVGPRGIRRSTNGGGSFAAVRSRSVRRAPLFGVDRAGGRTFAFGPRSLFASSTGRAWRRLRLPRGGVRELDFVGARLGYLLTSSPRRVYVTRNAGSALEGVARCGLLPVHPNGVRRLAERLPRPQVGLRRLGIRAANP